MTLSAYNSQMVEQQEYDNQSWEQTEQPVQQTPDTAAPLPPEQRSTLEWRGGVGILILLFLLGLWYLLSGEAEPKSSDTPTDFSTTDLGS